MLHHTFCHIPGIGYATEKFIWEQGVTTWEQLPAHPGLVKRVSERDLRHQLEQSSVALDTDPHFFTSRLKTGDLWRLFPHFRATTAYLDIETTGLGRECEITTIALYDGDMVHTYINGENLETFPEDIERYQVLVSYNGISFDIPVIEYYFKMKLKQAQIDLRHILARLGLKGGLKGCERQLGLNRGLLDGIDGAFAVLLWRAYERTGNRAALETLLAYNIEDTVNLERLMVEAFNRNVMETPFADELLLPFPEPPQIRHQADLEIVELVKRRPPVSI